MSKTTKSPATKPGHDPAPPGADNNTRLSFLESGASLLVLALAGAGVTIAVDADDLFSVAKDQIDSKVAAASEINRLADYLLAGYPAAIEGSAVDTAIKLIDQAKANLSMLTVAMCGANVDVPEDGDVITIAIAQFEALEDASAGGDATVGELAAIGRAETAEKRVAELEDQLEKVAAGVATGEPPVVEVPRDRADCGSHIGDYSAADIKAAIDEGGAFELVFSDGTREIIELEPIKLAATDLIRHGNRYMVAPSLLIAGPRGPDAVSLELHGAALLIDGEQIGFSPFERPLTLDPGDQRQFNRAFLFG